MKIILDNNYKKYIDKELFDYINQIWLNYDNVIANDSNIYFSKNATVNRLITDYTGKNISRVIKKEKADYVIINKISINNFPQYYDVSNNCIVQDDTKEVVYGIYNKSAEDIATIEQILDFKIRNQNVIYTNQDKLTDSLNNGFIINDDNYSDIKQLIDSNNSDNQLIALNMLKVSDLSKNWQWLLYLYHNRYPLLDRDNKNIIINYIHSLGLSYRPSDLFSKIDLALSVIKDDSVKNKFYSLINFKFERSIKSYLSEYVGTNKVELLDFKLKYNENT